MSITAFSAISLADILIIGVVLFFVFYGFKRGVLKTLYSILRIYFSFILTILLYDRLALLLQASSGMNSAAARILSFSVIFIVLITIIWVVGSLLRKKIARPSETSSSLSRIGGGFLGLLESILLISIIIMDINFYPASNGGKSPLEDTMSYKVIQQIAPSIEYFTIGPISRIKDISDISESEESEDEEL